MNLISASSSLLTALVLLSDAVWEASAQFTKMTGNGLCLDSAGNGYPWINTGLGENSPQRCYDWCTQAHAEKNVGFITSTWGTCACYFDSSTDLAAVKKSDYTNPPAFGINLTQAGTGKIVSTNGNSGISCYQNDVSLLCFCC